MPRTAWSRSGSSVRFYLDDDLAGKELTARLAAGGHEVIPTLRGEPDLVVWAYAQEHAATVVTQNAADFRALAATTASHHGVIVVYRDNDPRDMLPVAIAAAIDHLGEALPAGVSSEVVTLNTFR